MSQFYEYFWPIADTHSIAQFQEVGDNGSNIILNGIYANNVTGIVSFIGYGFIRNITLTSTDDLSTVDFIITGTQNGVPITETITGPNKDFVTSVNLYDVITSISVSGVAIFGEEIAIGTGLIGGFPLIPINTEKQISNVAYALSFIPENTCSYTLYGSLKTVISNGQTYKAMTNNSSLMPISPVGNTIQTLQSNAVYKNIFIAIVADNAASTLRMQFLQL